MKVSEIVNVTIGLSVTPASQASFNVPLLLVDHADVPIDQRYRQVTRSSYTSDLTAATPARNWCAALWGQNYNPAQAYIGRWVSAASSPYIAFPSAVETLATWTAVTTGYLKITDNTTPTPNTDEIGPLNFSAVTSMADVCQVIETALQAIGAPNITGLDTATCALDALDRPTITNSTSGAAAATISITTASTGIDIGGSGYLGADIVQAGLDAEALGTAMNAILALDNTPYIMCQRGGSIAQVVAFSTAVNALSKILLLVDNNTDSKNSGSTTDAPYQIEALSHQRTHICYTEHATANGAAANQHPDAAVIGEVLARLDKEGAINLALNPLSGVSESGLGGDLTSVIPLTAGERTALENKGCDYLVTPSTETHLTKGLAAGGNEIRVMIGKDFMEAKCSEEIYAYLVANEVTTFSDEDIQAFKGIVSYWADEMAERKLLDPTSFVWNFPEAADFTAAQKATHTMTLSDVLSANVDSAVNDIVMTLSFSV